MKRIKCAMAYDPAIHHRHSIRLPDYDYRQNGAYFVTICINQRAELLGEIVESEMHLNDAGKMLAAHWEELPRRFPQVELDEYVIMPNHLHGIIFIRTFANSGESLKTRPPRLGDIVGTYKSRTTGAYIAGVRDYNWSPFPGKLWQRNYYEHIIRSDITLNKIREYVINNPAQWAFDKENPAALPLPHTNIGKL